MALSYLDKSGLSYFWSKIKTTLDLKANADEVLHLTGGTVSGEVIFNSPLYLNGTTHANDIESNSLLVTGPSRFIGEVFVNNSITANSFIGNASSATKLNNSRTITIGNKSNMFDGTANINYTIADIGLGNVTNDKQVKGLASGTTENHVVTWGNNGYTIKDSGFTIASNVPANAKFTDTTYSNATTSANGLMSKEDKTKLNGIEANANNYVLPKATNTTLGGVKVGDGLSINNEGVLSTEYTVNTFGNQTINGTKTFNDIIEGDISGSSNSAYSLITPRNITIGSKINSFDGSKDISYSLDPSDVNLKIGGRNFFGFNKGIRISLIVPSYTALPDIKGFTLTVGSVDITKVNNIILRMENLGFEGISTYYTFSAWISATNNCRVKLDICDQGDTTVDLTSTPRKVVFTTKSNPYYTGTPLCGFFDVQTLEGYTIPANTVFTFKDVKIERGNVATEWTPAPEDLVNTHLTQTIKGSKTFTDITNINNTLNTFNVIPTSDNVYNIGTSSKRYSNIYGMNGIFSTNITSPYYIATTPFTLTSGKVVELNTANTSRLYSNGLVIANPAIFKNQGWIRVTGTSEADTVLELATGDGEQIVARQYNTSNTVSHELILMNKSGDMVTNNLLPNTTNTKDIGSSGLMYKSIYATTLNGKLSASNLTSGYISTSIEADNVLMASLNNDLAHLTQRGYSCTCYTTDSTDYTAVTLNKLTDVAIDATKLFDMSIPNFASFTVTNSTDVVVIDVDCPVTFFYSTYIYIECGSIRFQARDVSIYATSNTDTVYELTGSITNNTSAKFTCWDSLTNGIKKIRFVLTNFNSTTCRVAQIGVNHIASSGLRAGYMSRGIDDPIYRNITPNTDNTFTLGSPSKKWNNIYANRFIGTSDLSQASTSIRYEDSKVYAGENGIWDYSLIALDSEGQWQSFTLSGGTVTTKVINMTAKFKLAPTILFYNANNSTLKDALVPTSYALYSAHANVDLRYSTNCTTSTFTANKPIYLECIIQDGYFSPTTNCITQTLIEGKYYIYLGNSYSDGYHLILSTTHSVYYFDGTNLTDYRNNIVDNAIADNITSYDNSLKVYLEDTYYTNENANILSNEVESKATQEDVNNKYIDLTAKDNEIIEMIGSLGLDIDDYIRFKDTLLEMGYKDNIYMQTIASDKIAFMQGETEIASIHDGKIISNISEINDTLSIGKTELGFFDFLIENDGSLSVVWRGE